MLIAFITFAYCLFTLLLIISWAQSKPVQVQTQGQPGVRVSVVIVVRNEENNILWLLEDLNRQTYPASHIEVILIDDHSTDATLHQIASFRSKARFRLHILELKHYLENPLLNGNYKKKGIEVAVEQAQGELIITTDGDCRVGRNWLSVLAQFYKTQGAKCISGPVTFFGEQTFFERLQTVEFASLVGSGAALLQLGWPVMCNGANLAYTKEAFLAAGGYGNEGNSPSGDDIFLLQQINRLYPGKAFFLKSKQAIVQTKAKSGWKAFFQQRKRWASKWNLYQDKRASLLAIFIFISNACLLAALVLVLCGLYPLRMFSVQIAIRFSIEFVFLTMVLRFFNKERNIPFILPLQSFYFLYVSLFGFISHKKGYEWKGRKLK